MLQVIGPGYVGTLSGVGAGGAVSDETNDAFDSGRGNRFRQKTVHARIKTAAARVVIDMACEGNDRNSGTTARLGAQAACSFKPVFTRHGQIHQD